MNKTPNIKDWPNYHISRSGKLYSNHSGNWVIIKPNVKSNGYVHNLLYKKVNGTKYRANFYRHRLVAEVYLPNPDKLTCVCHKDNNPLNNRLSNLYWGTYEDNMQQCKRDGRSYQVGSIHRQKVYSRIDTQEIVKEYRDDKIPRKDILHKWHISLGVLYDILRDNQVELRLKRKSKRI